MANPATGTSLSAVDHWRSVVLYGRNVATYKIALGKTLLRFAAQQKTTIDLPELAEAFLEIYTARLKNPRPQINISGRRTLMERVVAAIAAGELSRGQAIEIVAREGFNDVVPRFHTLPNLQVHERFYVQEGYRLKIEDRLMELAASRTSAELAAELDARWSLLETAFQASYTPSELWSDGAAIYYGRSFERRAVTLARPVIEGYQNGMCFYCGDLFDDSIPHVDHFVPRSFLGHDEIWNLVLAHAACNLSKSDNIAPREYLDALYARNEYYIASNHPIKAHLIDATGRDSRARRDFLNGVYDRASLAVPRQWRLPQIRPMRDPLAPLRIV